MIRLSGLIDLKELISEEERYYARDPKGKQISVFTDKDNWEKAVNQGGYEEVDREEAEKELAQQKGAKPEAPPEEKPKPKMTKIAADPFDDEDSETGKDYTRKFTGTDEPGEELEKGTKVTASWKGPTGKQQEISDGEVIDVKHTERGMEYVISWNNDHNVIQLPADSVTSEEEPREKPSDEPEGGEKPSDSPEARLEKIDKEIEEKEDQRRILKQYMTSSGMGGISTDYLKKLEAEDAELLSQWRELQMTKMDIEAEIDAEEEPDDELVPGETWYSDEEDDEDDKDDWYKDESIIKNVGFKKYVSEVYGISQKKVNKPSIIKKKSKQPLVEQIKKDIDNSTVKKLVNQIIS